ncbi:Uncharacterised protein [Chlamydia trachomatis]|nr:Uncharacterised protein [Chlamydia trachomatis]
MLQQISGSLSLLIIAPYLGMRPIKTHEINGKVEMISAVFCHPMTHRNPPTRIRIIKIIRVGKTHLTNKITRDLRPRFITQRRLIRTQRQRHMPHMIITLTSVTITLIVIVPAGTLTRHPSIVRLAIKVQQTPNKNHLITRQNTTTIRLNNVISASNNVLIRVLVRPTFTKQIRHQANSVTTTSDVWNHKNFSRSCTRRAPNCCLHLLNFQRTSRN